MPSARVNTRSAVSLPSEMHGVPTRATVMALNGEFSTEYKTEGWNRNKYTRTIDGAPPI